MGLLQLGEGRESRSTERVKISFWQFGTSMHWTHKWGLMVGGLMFYILVNQFGPMLFALHGADDTALLSAIGTWVGSIGTVGTLIGAIWLASWETRTRQNEKLTLAIIQAAHCQHRIQAILGGLESISRLLTPPNTGMVPISNKDGALKIIRGFKKIGNEELAALVPLPGSCALKIADIQNALGNLEEHLGKIGTIERGVIGQQAISGLDPDSVRFAAGIALAQIERIWVVMDLIRDTTESSSL